MMKIWTYLGAASLALLVACGDDDPEIGTDAGSDAGPSNTIVDVASANTDLETLVAAVVKAELADDLAGTGTFTVFAPTDLAFTTAGIDPAMLTGEQLAEVLRYHVVAGAVPSTALAEGINVASSILPSAGSVTGDLSLVVVKDGATVTVNDATVTDADQTASNGVIHVIDTVLDVPTDIASLASEAGLSELVSVVGDADAAVATALTGAGPLTVFAPSNPAFVDIAATVDGLSMSQKTDVLLYHVVSGAVLSTALANGAVDTNLANGASTFEQVTIDVAGPSVQGVCNIDGSTDLPSNIVATDIIAPNGVIHLVDRVLLPAFACVG